MNFSHSLQSRDFINARKVTQMYEVLCILKNAAFVELSILRPVLLLMASVAILKVFLRLLGKWKHRYKCCLCKLFSGCAYRGAAVDSVFRQVLSHRAATVVLLMIKLPSWLSLSITPCGCRNYSKVPLNHK